jgi:hypothetical protein
LEGHLLVAEFGGEEKVASVITDGVAMFRSVGTFDACRIQTAGRRSVGTVVLDTTE